ncbi:MAG: inositol monophosphatase family protein [Burkholderiales bacterium]
MLEAVINVVRRVANVEIVPRFRSATGSRKADGTLLSDVDQIAQQALAKYLSAIAPVPVLGEEMGADAQARAWDRGAAGLWCVDPIDGTTNYLHGLPFFSISVAYMVNGRTELGVVYHPMQAEMFSAERGKGATLNGVSLLAPTAVPTLDESVAAIEPKQLALRLRSAIAAGPPYYSMRNWGAGTLDWCYLAAGRFDVFLHGGQRLWDYAAGALILEEAGGVIETIEGEQFWTASPWRRSVIAAGAPALFGEWAAWVRMASGIRPGASGI